MGNKKFVRIVAIILAIIMLLSVAMIAIELLVSSTASARVTQTQINDLRTDKRDLERRKREITSKINAIEFERMAAIEQKEVLDERIVLTGLEIDNINEIISYYDLLIREKEYEVYLAQGREDEQLARYKNRVRNMEENGIITYLEIIFDSTSFSDMLARIDFVADIMRSDENAYNNLIIARSETEEAKVELEGTKVEMEEEKVELEQKEIELYEQLEEAHAIILLLESNLDTERELRKQVVAEEDRVQKEINAAVAALARQQEQERLARLRAQQARAAAASRASAAAGGNVTGTGELARPVSGVFTSGFGIRRHPVYGDLRMHNGVDWSAPHGTRVSAADSGTVIISSYNSSYGNYVVVDHANGMTTLYAHLSSRSVSVGTTVSRGQQVGLVGSTGVSTGPHLHFEVSINGVRINPLTRL